MALRSVLYRLICTLLFLGSISAAWAEPINVPRAVEADTIARQAETLRQQQPQAPIEIGESPEFSVNAPPGADNVRFILQSVTIGGSSAYSQKELAETYKNMIGKEVSLADMYGVAARVTQRYRDDGYLLSRAFLPAQKISKGTVHIDVIEGYVAKITWAGDALDSDIANTLAERLAASYPFSGKTLENVTMQLNALPSVAAQATIAPYTGSDAQDGAVEIVLTITRKHISASASVDNYASRYQGVWEDSYQASLSGLITSVDQLSFNTLFSADPRYTHYFRGEYSIPINADGTSLKFGASKSESAPGYRLADLDIRSTQLNHWIGATQSLILTRAESLSLDGQFNMNDQATNVLGQRFYDDRLRTLQLAANYTRSDAWDGENSLVLGVEHGFNILNATQPGDPFLSRHYGQSDFTKLTFNASRLQELPRGFSLLLAGTGQASNTPLLTSEQFGFGGPAFGRAYDPSEISGDNGVAGSIELRYDDDELIENMTLQPFIYYDAGKVWNRSVEGIEQSAASAGGGARLRLTSHAQLELFAAKPLTLVPEAPKLGAVGNNPRYEISLKISY